MTPAQAAALATLDAAVDRAWQVLLDLGMHHPEQRDEWQGVREALFIAAARVRFAVERDTAPDPAHRYLCDECGVRFAADQPIPPGSPALCGEHDAGMRRAG